ncbi:MAG: hypothetical protein IKI95_05575, partial [Clostridia bacterium]|nr:hypothetical protein [Clostridia bacterium]
GKVTGFFLFRNLINSYNEDKQANDEERKNIKKYGIASLILSGIGLLISLSCLIFSLINLDLAGFSYGLIMIVYILGGVVISALLAIYGFIFAVMQIRLNRKALGVIGLVLSVLSLIASVLLVVFMII